MKTNPLKISILLLFLIFRLSASAQEIWGMTQYGGSDNKGVIFKLDENGENQQVVFSFESIGMPEGGMTEYTDGSLYGMTTSGGKNGSGVIYRFEPDGGKFTKIVDFDGDVNGEDGAGTMVLASNNRMYGMTASGGAQGEGTIFEFDPESGSLTTRISFDGKSRGSEPLGNLIEGEDGNLYGMTSMGGAYNLGVVFMYNYTTDSFEKIIDFAGEATGSNPMGSLTKASDNSMYGMTRWGGINDHGVIFKLDPQSRDFGVVFEFDGPNTGRNPQGSLLLASNGKMYGTTAYGGADNLGVLFEYDPVTETFTGKFAYPDPFFKLAGSLAEGPDKRLFGVNHSSYNDTYVLLEYDLEDEGFYNYLVVENGLREYYGNPESMTVTSDGKVYFWGRDAFYFEKEVFLFEFDPAQNEFTKFHSNSTCDTGSQPHGDLVQAPNGNLYAMTSRGGSYDAGTLLEYDPVSNRFSKKMDFDPEATGANPLGSMVLYDDSLLFGMTSQGGSHGYGVLFRYNLMTNSYTRIIDFNGTEYGKNPQGSLVRASDGNLYGMTPGGGTHDLGTLFSYNPATGAFTKIMNFVGSVNGATPQGSLLHASNGKLYGVSDSSFFEYDYHTNTFRKLYDTGGSSGELIEASDNHLYFSARSAVYDYDPVVQTLEKIDIPHVIGPIGRLLEYTPGKLLGMAFGEMSFYPGLEDKGCIFELDPGSKSTLVKMVFEGDNGMHPNNGGLIKLHAAADVVTSAKPSVRSEVRVYPNPFYDKLNFSFIAPETANARIDLFDPSGRLVTTVYNQKVHAGMEYTVHFDAGNMTVSHFLYRIQIGTFRESGIAVPFK